MAYLIQNWDITDKARLLCSIFTIRGFKDWIIAICSKPWYEKRNVRKVDLERAALLLRWLLMEYCCHLATASGVVTGQDNLLSVVRLVRQNSSCCIFLRQVQHLWLKQRWVGLSLIAGPSISCIYRISTCLACSFVQAFRLAASFPSLGLVPFPFCLLIQELAGWSGGKKNTG